MKLQSRLLSEIKHARTIVGISVLLGLAGGILGIAQAREVSKLINRAFLNSQGLNSLAGLFYALLIIILFRMACVFAGEYTAGVAARKIKQELRHRLFSHLIRLGPAYLTRGVGDDNRTGELTNLALDGIEAIEVYYSQYLPQVALAALVPLAILFFVFPADLLSGIILLVTAPLLPLFMYLAGSAAESLTRNQWRGLSRMSAYFLDVIQGLTTLKSLGRSHAQVEVVSKVSEQYRKTTMDVLRVTFLSALVLELIATLSTAVVAVQIGIRLLYGKMVFEQAFFVLLLAPEFYHPLRLLGQRFHAGMAGVEASKRLFSILDTPVVSEKVPAHPASSNPPGNQVNYPPGNSNSPPSIRLSHVRYVYPASQHGLRDISIELPAGEITALVGESGAGKTTLTWLLMGFLNPQNGEILADGNVLGDIPVKAWREQLAWVPQHPYLFSDTVAENIKLARPAATLEQVRQAARLAQAHEFIEQLPQAYETRIGERGTRLSAGQAQRIALARAFLKDAPFLILDEATSHLDPDTHSQLLESMGSLMNGRTVLLIAHHRGTLRYAHRVIQLSQGKVIETRAVEHAADYDNPAHFTPVVQSSNHPDEGPEDSGNRNNTSLRGFLPNPPVIMRLIKLLTPFAGRILLSILLGVATIASGIGLMATAAYIISAAALHPSIAELQVAIAGVRFFGLSRGVFRYLERLVSHDVTFRLLGRWRVWFYQAIEPLAPARFLQLHSGDLLSRVIGDIATLESFYVRAIAPPLVALVIALCIYIFIGAFGFELSLALSGFMLIAGVGLPVLVYLLSRRWGPEIVRTRAEMSRLFVDGIQGLPDLLANGQEDSQINRIDRASASLVQVQGKMSAVYALQNAFGSFLASLAMLAILALAIGLVAQGNLSAVLLGMLALLVTSSFEAFQPLSQAAQNYSTSRAAASRLYELVDTQPAVSDPAAPLDLPNRLDIDVRHLSFRYPSQAPASPGERREAWVLRELSFSLPQGKRIALVGPSGAGKTTLINLLQRFWEYEQGSILLGGKEIRDYHQEELRKHMAVISQNTYMFNATIKDNLLLANPTASEDAIAQALKIAQLSNLVHSLPDGYQTWIGEQGLRLSAGERQRLAIARAVLADAQLLILDEPTANLDPATEAAMLESIHEISAGRSVINITQRMSGLELMDEILVLREGRIIERGTHAELLSRTGDYARMWELYNQAI